MAAIELVKDPRHAGSRRPISRPPRSRGRWKVAGLLLLKTGIYDNVLRILVPITATEEDLELGLDRLEESLPQPPESTTTAAVTLRGVRKSYGDVDAVAGVDLASSSRCWGRPVG